MSHILVVVLTVETDQSNRPCVSFGRYLRDTYEIPTRYLRDTYGIFNYRNVKLVEISLLPFLWNNCYKRIKENDRTLRLVKGRKKMALNTKKQVEFILGRDLTIEEVSKYRFYWTKVFMNPHDICSLIKH
jgi:uncharacterized membrane protein